MTALYRSLVAGKRVLVVLDNARDADHVRPLLPGTATAMVLVTSRNQLTPLVAIDGAHPITLDLLSTEDALGLLAGRLGEGRVTAEPDAVEAIITACARLPLALSIAAARAQETGFPLAGLAAELDEAGSRLDALDAGDAASQVRAVFSWSYATLTAPAARLFRLLGLHPGPHIATATAAGLASEPLSGTRRMLTELVRANLLVEYGPGRFVFHDLLRAYATELSHTHDAEDERRAAIGRMLGHYRQAVTDPPSGDWLDTELPNLLGATGCAIEHGEPEYVLHLSSALRRYLRTRGLHSEAETLYQQALTAALTTGHRVGEVDALNGFGYIDRLRGRPQQATDRYEQAVRTARAIDYGAGEVEALIGLARVHLWQGRYAEAIDHFEQALRVARATGRSGEEVDALAGLGHLLRMRGQHEQAAEHYQHALRIAQETGHQLGELTALSGLGHIHRWYGRYAEATEHFEQVLRIARDNGHHSGELSALSILADIHRFHRRHELASDYLDQLVELATSSGDRNFEYEAWQGRGRLRFQAGDPDAAVAHHERALALAGEMGQPVDEARALDGLALAQEARGEREQARAHWQRALDILAELGVDDTEDAEMTVETIRAHLDRISAPSQTWDR